MKTAIDSRLAGHEPAHTWTMHAIVQNCYGTDPEDVLRMVEVAVPTFGDDGILVRVHAASVDRGTWHIMTGLPALMRLMGFGLRRPSQANPGRALAGVVEAVGKNVRDFKAGDEVYGTAAGTFSEYVCAEAGTLALKPVDLTFEQAAAAPISGLAALQAVRDHARVHAGHKVLIIGASGGVGTFAVQIAKAFGAEVTGVCSKAKMDLVRGLGADHVIDYSQEDVTGGAHHYDAVIDIGGNTRVSHLRRALTAHGRLVIVGGETDGRWLGGIDRQLRAVVLSPLVSQKLTMLATSENSADLTALGELLQSGNVTSAIHRAYPLSRAAAAIRHLVDGTTYGKVVITV